MMKVRAKSGGGGATHPAGPGSLGVEVSLELVEVMRGGVLGADPLLVTNHVPFLDVVVLFEKLGFVRRQVHGSLKERKKLYNNRHQL